MTDLISAEPSTPRAESVTGLDLRVPDSAAHDPAPVMISVVMPCLNEEASVAQCVAGALRGIARTGLSGEVVVCDNGSSDRSVEVARAAGAVVVEENRRGYGNAYRRGFAAARGAFLVMGDSDCSYDFSRLDELVTPLLAGYDYVLGSRFAGEMLPGAMPWSHRYLGNPLLTGALNRLFGLKTSDAHSGMRAFTREAYLQMALRCEGMEFASEVVISAARRGLRMTEVPITYHPRVGDSKLRGLRDALRHLRYMLLQCPRQLFVLPGGALLAGGLLAQAGLLAGPAMRDYTASILLSACFALLAVLGFQATLFGVFAMVAHPHVAPTSRLVGWIKSRLSLERGVGGGAFLFLAGVSLDLVLLLTPAGAAIGVFREAHWVVLSLTLMAMGVQASFGALYLGLIREHALGFASGPAIFPSEQLASGSAAR